MAHPDYSKHTRPTDTPAPLPKTCPACTSGSILSTAKVPTLESYWRCQQCGEVWSPARRQSFTGRRW